jgi:surfeit locus 1 family protein
VTLARFSVGTWAAIGGLALLAVLFFNLGTWQLRRADESRDLAAQFAAGAGAAPLQAPPAAFDEAERFRRLTVRGAYVDGSQFLLDNMLHDGTAGYHVLTPMRLDGSSRWLLVNRGWVPSGLDRRLLPAVDVGTEPRTVTGRIERLPRPGLNLGESARVADRVPLAVVEYPTTTELAERIGEPLFDYELLLDPAEPDGYLRDWQAPGLGPDRHLAYAGQWLLLAAGAVVAAVTIGIRTARHPRET